MKKNSKKCFFVSILMLFLCIFIALPGSTGAEEKTNNQKTVVKDKKDNEPTADVTNSDKNGTSAAQKNTDKKVISTKEEDKAEQAKEAKTEENAQKSISKSTDVDNSLSITLKNLEEKIFDIKEKIFRSKAKLLKLKEAVLHGVISGAKARIIHLNDMGSGYRLVYVSYTLDGAPVYSKQFNEDEGNSSNPVTVYEGRLAPGSHTVSVFMVYQGSGYGFFSYLKGYKFKLRSSYTFRVAEGKVTEIKVVGYKRGTIFTDYRKRPSIRYDVKITNIAEEKKKESEEE